MSLIPGFHWTPLCRHLRGQMTPLWSMTWWRDTGDVLPLLSSTLSPCLTGPSRLVLHLTTNRRSAPLFLSWLFINRPGRPRLALEKIKSYQYSTSEEEGNKGVFRRDFWFCIWKSDGQSGHMCMMSLKQGWRMTFVCAGSKIILEI